MALKGLVVGVGAVAVTGVAIGSIIAAAGWLLAASVGAQANIAARPIAPQFTAVADWRDSAADVTGSVQALAAPINAPNLNLVAQAGPARTSIFNPMGALALLPESIVEAPPPPSRRDTTPAPVKAAALVDLSLD